ncbi:hypothetical protein E2F43_01565 [Seongchinamella unica]|uniref:Uncharacterized protein n=1 Tax=Seongchinamella unica TaxID=2547392 RepID=A0A4R5LWY0_9GAMM|nr:hypothetical protein E2F43_01565 [Seongchinamella unica]
MAALLTGVVGYLLMHQLQTQSVQSVQHSINAWRMALALLRWTLIAFVALGWNHLITRLASAGIITHSKVTSLAALRWRTVTLLVLVELVLGQGVLVNALSLMSGTLP